MRKIILPIGAALLAVGAEYCALSGYSIWRDGVWYWKMVIETGVFAIVCRCTVTCSWA